MRPPTTSSRCVRSARRRHAHRTGRLPHLLHADFPERDRLFTADEWINTGGASVVDSSGTVVAGPQHRDKRIPYAEIDAEAALVRSLHVTGHYARPGLFSLSVNRSLLLRFASLTEPSWANVAASP